MGVRSVWAQLWRWSVLGVFLLAGVITTFLSGVGGRPMGELIAPALLAIPSATIAWLLWWRRSEQLPAVAVAAVLAVVAGVAVHNRTPPGPVVLGRALDEVTLPAAAQLQEESTGGNVLCFDVCRYVRRRYTAPGPADGVTQHLRAALRDAGYELQEPADGRYITTRLNGEMHITASVNPPGAPPAPENHVVLRLIATASG